jgi:hypothetical protein
MARKLLAASVGTTKELAELSFGSDDRGFPTALSHKLILLRADHGLVVLPAYTDLRLHGISATSDPTTDPECEPLDQNQPAGSPEA